MNFISQIFLSSGYNMEENDDDIEKNNDLSLTKEEQPPEEMPEEQPEQAQKPAEAKKEEPKIEEKAQPQARMGVIEWLKLMKWETNPFVFNIVPSLFVGYKSQAERIMISLEERHKFILILGPTGSGKTTILKWLPARLKKFDILYIGKPPQRIDEFVEIFNNKYRRPWYAFWDREIRNVYQIPDMLNKKLKTWHLVIMVDEAHEANTEVLEWLRVLNDQVLNLSIVLSGLPVFEDQLRNNLETFAKRITAKVELLSLTKEETKELVKMRIMYAGGTGSEFSDDVINSIYEYTGGFPREIIRVCDELVNNAMLKGKTQIEFDIYEKKEERTEEARPVTMSILDKMTPMQKEILEMLSKKPLTPGQIANALDLSKYKSRQHAVRSVNNVVKNLMEDGYLERRKEEKAFVYSLSPKLSTLFVKR